MKTRKAYINKFKSYLGTNAKTIIDIYNSIKPLPNGYRLTVGKDAWCAATVSAVAYTLGYQDIIPLECSCGRMIDKAQEMGIWVENDAYVPKTGDIIMYDWQDSGKGDNTEWPDHVGAVVSVDGSGNMTIIEGNIRQPSPTVAYRHIKVNDRYIRGYITPRYDADQPEPEFIFTLDSAGANGISGWLYDGTDKTYDLHCYIDGHGFNGIYTNIFRQDLKDNGIGNGKHGFNWDKDLYEIFGNGTFKMSIFAITESGSNPCVYDGEITIYREPAPEEPATPAPDTPTEPAPDTPTEPVPEEPDYAGSIENLNKAIEEVSLKIKNIEIEVNKYSSVVQTIDTNLKTLKEKLRKVINAL